ncbi:hypothetical protein [Nitriliruptor alkaliphilus]|uniref:hypothetical protein n=1 Tax=Nitriliruptor alkaliphilus TaxID=427918 RepID=UPI00069785C6|nr:hypothetical protein [Nitriliruptor alkaliphilus]
MGHATIPHPAPFKLWGTALLVLVAVTVAVLLASLLSTTSTATAPAPTDHGSDATSATQTTPCGLPWAVARVEGLDPRSCETPREPLRITGPR